MKKKRGDPLEPKVYLPSIDHPEYVTHQWQYFWEHHKSRFRGLSFLGDPRDHASVWQHEIEQAKINSDESDKYVIAAIKLLFGEHPIELAASLTPFRLCDEANRLGGVVCRVLGHLSREGQEGDFNSRKEAKRRFEKIVNGISPDARGKKKNTTSPLQVRLFYWNELFRLYHVRKALKSPLHNIDQKVKEVSDNFRSPAEQIKEFWRLDQNTGQPVRPIPLTAMARILAARHFKLTENRISNILSSQK